MYIFYKCAHICFTLLQYRSIVSTIALELFLSVIDFHLEYEAKN